MKVRCINNTGKSIKKYEYKSLKKGQLGRFGATEHTQFGLEIGKEFLVMGMLFGEGALDYLIDDGGYISAYPYPLFEVIKSLPFGIIKLFIIQMKSTLIEKLFGGIMNWFLMICTMNNW
mgnify:CR=1 FL=1